MNLQRQTGGCVLVWMKPASVALTLSLVAALLWVSAFASGCGGPDPERVNGIEAVPAGHALEVVATTSHGARVDALIVPEMGLFRIELQEVGVGSAGMLITVRTPDTQLGYRGGSILEGKPHPLRMAFLESPLTYDGPYSLKDLKWEGDTCTATLKETHDGSRPGSYSARIDPATGLVVWESQEWDDYRGTVEITRRLVPLGTVRLPAPEEVFSYAEADWAATLAEAGSSGFPVFGLALDGLRLHSMGVDVEVTGIRYSTDVQPGRIAAELEEYPEEAAAEWPAELRTGWQEAWSDDHQVPGYAKMVMTGGRGVYIRVYAWALEELGVTTADVEASLTVMDSAGGSPAPKPPHLVFDELMPLPQGADFAETLPEESIR